MEEQQPELRWAPLPPKPKKTGKVWLIIALSVAVLAIAGVLLFFLLPRADTATPSPSGSPTTSATPSASPSATPTPEPSVTPITTAPPVGDPTMEEFRGQVSGWLNTAPRGLDIVASASGQDALPVVESLELDAQRLSDAQPPSSIDQDWRDGVVAYAEDLTQLRMAITDGSGVSAPLNAARTSVESLRTLVGL